MPYDERLAERIRDLVSERPEVTEKKMFGGLAFMRNGLMFAGVSGEELMARIAPENYGAALARPHVREMDFTGRPMKGYVFVEAAGLKSKRDLERWIELCLEFVATLPPKKK